MGFSFIQSPSYLFTSESVTEGHPDKLCDQISDAVLDAILAHDPDARVACETCVSNCRIVVMGEITTDTEVDFQEIARETVRETGYVDSRYGFDYRSCQVDVYVQSQSPDIAQGVDQALEVRGRGHSDDTEAIGAGDQGMMVGYACTETEVLMPLPIYLAHRICQRLAEVRKEGVLPYLRPDGKSQVTVEYEYGVPKRVHTVVISAQHEPDVDSAIIERDLIEEVAKAVIPQELRDSRTQYYINPSGRFVIGGPVGDTGLTGRKILVDTYGGFARHGGGAFSGKDPTKVDRSAAYAARYVAKNLVAAGLADRLELQVSYAIGKAEPISISVEAFGTNRVPDSEIIRLIRKHFDLRPGAIIKALGLRAPIYKPTAAYGHFGRQELDLPWERTDKAEALRRDAFADLSRGHQEPATR